MYSILTFIVTIGTIWQLVLSDNESKEATIRNEKQKNNILRLENNLLKQGQELTNQKDISASLSKDLSDERNKIKAISARVEIEIDKTWPDNNRPYAPLLISTQLHDMILVEAYAQHKIHRRIYFYPSELYQIGENSNGLYYSANLTLRSSADIFAATKSEILNFNFFAFKVPLIYWRHQAPYPLPVKYVKLEIRINDTDIYTIRKNVRTTYLPNQQPEINGTDQEFFLKFYVNINKRDFKISKR
jgi:hypothetical protein